MTDVLERMGFFYASPISIDTSSIEELFIYRVFKMLLKKGLITERVIELMLSWRHLRLWALLRGQDKSL